LEGGLIYAVWLVGFSVFFLLVERWWPRRRQPVLRRAAWSDFLYLVFNSEYAGLLTGLVAARVFATIGRPAALP
jgi:hypothetical protein